jgi:hypothetical protein
MFSLLSLISSFAVVQTGAATDSSSDIAHTEKLITAQLDMSLANDVQPKDLTKAIAIREKIKGEMAKQIDQSISQLSDLPQPLVLDTVYLGYDKTFYTADIGDYGWYLWGSAFMAYGSEYKLSQRKALATSCVGPAGVGGCACWVWVGKEFFVSGSGSRVANINVRGHMFGLTSAVAAGSAESRITFVVLDRSTGTKYTTQIYHQSASGAEWYEVNQYFNNGVAVTLMGQHIYSAYILLETTASVYLTGEAGADFGPYDFDPGDVYYNYIKIDF